MRYTTGYSLVGDLSGAHAAHVQAKYSYYLPRRLKSSRVQVSCLRSCIPVPFEPSRTAVCADKIGALRSDPYRQSCVHYGVTEGVCMFLAI